MIVPIPTSISGERGPLLVAGLLAALGVACGEASSSTDVAAQGSERRTPVVVTAPFAIEFFDRLEALGTALADESVVITARVTETVQRVNFEDGQTVEAGAILVELTSAEESAQLEAARANFAEALRQYRRIAELAAKGSESQSRLDERTAARDAAAARLAELQARMADRMIQAPFRGVLGLRAVSPGSLLQPGDAITTLDAIDRIKLDFSIPERFLATLRPGLEISARSAAYPGEEFIGTVRAVESRVDPSTRAVRARAEIPNADHRLRPGMLLTTQLKANPQLSLALPEEALIPAGTQQFVLVVDPDERVRRIEVQIGRREPGRVEIVEGIDADQIVVIEGADMARPGSLVRVVRTQATPGV